MYSLKNARRPRYSICRGVLLINKQKQNISQNIQQRFTVERIASEIYFFVQTCSRTYIRINKLTSLEINFMDISFHTIRALLMFCYISKEATGIFQKFVNVILV